MDLRRIITPMAIETDTFCDKTATPIQAVALSALYVQDRRMQVKRLKGRWRTRAGQKMHFLFAAPRPQDQRIKPGGTTSQALWSTLLVFQLLPAGFSNRNLRDNLAPLLGQQPTDLTSGRMTISVVCVSTL
jgi:hypothetical protein